MNFIVHKRGSHAVVCIVSERLDGFSSPGLKAQFVMLVNEGICDIILDLSGCLCCDSSGLSAILVGNRLCSDCEGAFILCNLFPSVDKIIRLAMLDSILLIVPKLADAEKFLLQKAEL